MKNIREANKSGVLKKTSKFQIQGIAKAETILTEGDIMVLYGNNDDINKLLKE